jgi:hypothetical protein
MAISGPNRLRNPALAGGGGIDDIGSSPGWLIGTVPTRHLLDRLESGGLVVLTR